MTPIRYVGRALIVAGLLALPALASADAPSELCDDKDKMEQKEPTAEKSGTKQDAEKSGKKAEDAKEPKSDAKESDKSS